MGPRGDASAKLHWESCTQHGLHIVITSSNTTKKDSSRCISVHPASSRSHIDFQTSHVRVTFKNQSASVVLCSHFRVLAEIDLCQHLASNIDFVGAVVPASTRLVSFGLACNRGVRLCTVACSESFCFKCGECCCTLAAVEAVVRSLRSLAFALIYLMHGHSRYA
jgi:hypothetical protein